VTWSEYGKWSLSLIRNVLAHLEYLLYISLGFRSSALEIGCGTGLHSCFVSHFGVDVTSIDVDCKVVKMASILSHHYKAKNVNLVVADARNLPFKDALFNVCFSQGLLEHFDNRNIIEIISEASRVAERILFSVPSINYPRQDFGNERLLNAFQWKDLLSKFDVKVRYYRVDLQSIKESLLSWKVLRPWHLLIDIKGGKG
jgi:SAM-dependent methyltransferase